MFTIPFSPASYSLMLHCAEGSSDKIYEIEIRPTGDRWETLARWGRRGSTMQTAAKTNGSVAYDAARRVASDLARQKLAKGYRVIEEQAGGPSQRPSAQPAPAPAAETPKTFDIPAAPQLAAPARLGSLDMLIGDETYVAQEKFFGERRMLVKRNKAVFGYNRRRAVVDVAPAIADAACSTADSFVLDAEIIGDAIYAFDLLSFNESDLTRLPLDYRLTHLSLLGQKLGPAIMPVYTAFNTADKRKLFEQVRLRDGEGLVFKKRHGLYIPGRPAGDPGWLKFKFHEMLSAIVAGHNAQRSVALALLDDAGRQIPVGNVTIPVNAEVPALGAVVEIRYLFAYENGSLYEPVYLGERADIAPDECLASQRKFKPPVAA